MAGDSMDIFVNRWESAVMLSDRPPGGARRGVDRDARERARGERDGERHAREGNDTREREHRKAARQRPATAPSLRLNENHMRAMDAVDAVDSVIEDDTSEDDDDEGVDEDQSETLSGSSSADQEAAPRVSEQPRWAATTEGHQRVSMDAIDFFALRDDLAPSASIERPGSPAYAARSVSPPKTPTRRVFCDDSSDKLPEQSAADADIAVEWRAAPFHTRTARPTQPAPLQQAHRTAAEAPQQQRSKPRAASPPNTRRGIAGTRATSPLVAGRTNHRREIAAAPAQAPGARAGAGGVARGFGARPPRDHVRIAERPTTAGCFRTDPRHPDASGGSLRPASTPPRAMMAPAPRNDAAAIPSPERVRPPQPWGRSKSPGPGRVPFLLRGRPSVVMLANARPFSPGRVRSSTDRDPRRLAHCIPAALRASIGRAGSVRPGHRVHDTATQVAAVLGDGGAGGEAAEEMFSQVAKPSSANLRSSDPAVLLGMVEGRGSVHGGAVEYVVDKEGFRSCLDLLDALQGSNPVLEIELDILGVRGAAAKEVLLTRHEADHIFEGSARDGPASEIGYAMFLERMRKVASMLRTKRHTVEIGIEAQRQKSSKNRRLPMKQLLELRGKTPHVGLARRGSVLGDSESEGGSVAHGGIAVRASRRHLGEKEKGGKVLAKQLLRRCLARINADVATQASSLATLRWLLVIRDKALASLDLLRRKPEDEEEDDEGDAGGAGDIAAAGGDMARGGKLVDTPAWAWGIKVDPTASPAALPDGWYLVSDDPGPKLRVAGPLKMQRACWQEILDSSDSFGIQTFRVVHLVHGKPVQSTGYDKAGQPLRTHQKDLPDGFYVMIKSAERDVWQTRMKLVAADRAVLAAKQRAAKARLVREGAKGSMAAAEKRQEDLAATEKRVHAGNTQNRARNTALGHSRGQLPGAPEEKAKSRPKEMLEVQVLEPYLVWATDVEAQAHAAVRQAVAEQEALTRDLEKAQAQLPNSEMVLVEGPMPLEVMARTFCARKRSARVREALRVVKVESGAMEESEWRASQAVIIHEE